MAPSTVYNCALLQSGVFVALSELLNRSADCFGLKRNFQDFFNLLVGQFVGTTEKFFKHSSTGAESVCAFFACELLFLRFKIFYFFSIYLIFASFFAFISRNSDGVLFFKLSLGIFLLLSVFIKNTASLKVKRYSKDKFFDF